MTKDSVRVGKNIVVVSSFEVGLTVCSCEIRARLGCTDLFEQSLHQRASIGLSHESYIYDGCLTESLTGVALMVLTCCYGECLLSQGLYLCHVAVPSAKLGGGLQHF